MMEERVCIFICLIHGTEKPQAYGLHYDDYFTFFSIDFLQTTAVHPRSRA